MELLPIATGPELGVVVEKLVPLLPWPVLRFPDHFFPLAHILSEDQQTITIEDTVFFFKFYNPWQTESIGIYIF